MNRRHFGDIEERLNPLLQHSWCTRRAGSGKSVVPWAISICLGPRVVFAAMAAVYLIFFGTLFKLWPRGCKCFYGFCGKLNFRGEVEFVLFRMGC